MALDPTNRGNVASLSDEEDMATYYNMEREAQPDEDVTKGRFGNNIQNTNKRNPKSGSSQSVLLVNDDAPGSRWGVVKNKISQRAKKSCTKKLLYKRLPVLGWAPKYNSEDAVGDLVAGITVGLTVIPQSLAYANLAQLPPQYGLYGAFFGSFLYIIFGSCKDVPMGPTAVVSLLTFQQVGHHGENAFLYAILLNFLAGCIELGMGILGLGFLIDFISGPVASGFTSAVALIIVTSQIKDILGITGSGATFIEYWQNMADDMHNAQLWDPILGVICIIVLLLLKLLTTVKIGPKDGTPLNRTQIVINKIIWLIGTARNVIVMIITIVIGYLLVDSKPFKLTGDIAEGLPAFQLPPFGFENGNTTVTFSEMASELGTGLVVIPLVALLEDIAICKAFSKGKAVDATQELIAIGICNIANSFVQAYPGSGALSRSAVQNASGVRTQFVGAYTGTLVILALLFLTQIFYYIPKAALAAIIIAAVIFMVEIHVVKPMWKTKKSDLIPGFGTFIACLVLPIEFGILVGIGINILFILYYAARPKISIENEVTQEGVEYLLLTPDRYLIFPSVDYVRNLVNKNSIRHAIPVVIDCSHIYGADFTAAKVIECITQDFSSRKQPLFFYNLKPSVVAVFKGLQPKDFVVYYSEDELDNLIRGHKKQTEQDKIETEISIVDTR